MKAIAAVILALAATDASAENRPFKSLNGRTQVGAAGVSAEQPRSLKVTPGGSGGFGVGAAQAPALGTGIVDAPLMNGGVAFMGATGARSGGRSFRGVSRSGKAFRTSGGRAVGVVGLAGGAGGATTATTDPGAPGSNEEAPPPYMTTWGAKILTAGQAPKYNEPATGERQHTVYAGEIAFNPKKGYDVGKAPSVQQGPKDTLPPPNPTSSGNYGSGISANGPLPTTTPSGSGSLGGGKDNNGSGNNGKDKPGDDDDGKGRDKAFDDPTGFYSAF